MGRHSMYQIFFDSTPPNLNEPLIRQFFRDREEKATSAPIDMFFIKDTNNQLSCLLQSYNLYMNIDKYLQSFWELYGIPLRYRTYNFGHKDKFELFKPKPNSKLSSAPQKHSPSTKLENYVTYEVIVNFGRYDFKNGKGESILDVFDNANWDVDQAGNRNGNWGDIKIEMLKKKGINSIVVEEEPFNGWKHREVCNMCRVCIVSIDTTKITVNSAFQLIWEELSEYIVIPMRYRLYGKTAKFEHFLPLSLNFHVLTS